MTSDYVYVPEVLGVCDLCDRDVTEEDESQFDAEGYMHQACIDQLPRGRTTSQTEGDDIR